MYQYPKHIHHFSWLTKISLELPLSFEEAEEDPENNSAVYADDLAADDETGGRVLTKVTPVPEGQDQAYQTLARTSAEIAGRQLLFQDELVIDGAPCIRQAFRYYQEDAHMSVFHHETHGQLGNLVFSIICLAPADRQEEYQSVFAESSKTARFILL